MRQPIHTNSPIIILLLLGLLLGGCEKLFFEKEIKNTPQSNFDYLWQQVHDKYAFLDYKGVDWDQTKAHYQKQITNDMSDEALFDVLAEMLNTLRDGHVNLQAPFNVSRYDVIFLGSKNIDHQLIRKNYLKSDYYITGSFKHNFISNGKVGYIKYGSFNDGVISDYELDYLLQRYKDTKGLVLDLRENGGGFGVNVGILLERFTFEKTLIHTVEAKSGPGAKDFTPIKQVYVDPSKEKDDLIKYDKPVAVLIDRGSYSASSFFALSTKAYNKLFLVGDTTGGGLGMPNGGQLPNGWTYRFSITRTLDAKGENHENGVPPDMLELLAPQYVERGIDNVIERAVAALLNKEF